MKKLLTFIAISIAIFLAWPSIYSRTPSCPYDDANKCALFDPAPQYARSWFSGYRLVSASFNPANKLIHEQRLKFSDDGNGGIENFDFNIVPFFLVALAVVVYFWPKQESYDQLMLKYKKN